MVESRSTFSDDFTSPVYEILKTRRRKAIWRLAKVSDPLDEVDQILKHAQHTLTNLRSELMAMPRAVEDEATLKETGGVVSFEEALSTALHSDEPYNPFENAPESTVLLIDMDKMKPSKDWKEEVVHDLSFVSFTVGEDDLHFDDPIVQSIWDHYKKYFHVYTSTSELKYIYDPNLRDDTQLFRWVRNASSYPVSEDGYDGVMFHRNKVVESYNRFGEDTTSDYRPSRKLIVPYVLIVSQQSLEDRKPAAILRSYCASYKPLKLLKLATEVPKPLLDE